MIRPKLPGARSARCWRRRRMRACLSSTMEPALAPDSAGDHRRPMKFGFCVPIFANPGAAFFRTPAATALDPVAAVEAAVEAERLGFDSAWVADHLMHGYDN